MEKIIDILLLLYFSLFPFGQLVKIPLGIPEVNLYLADVIVGILGLIGVLWIIRKRMLWPPVFKSMALFISAAGFSLLVNLPRFQLREIIIASFYLVRLITYFGFYLVLYRFRKQVDFKRCLIVCGMLLAVFGLGQYLIMPDMTSLTVFGWDPHYYRLVGTFLDPGFTGKEESALNKNIVGKIAIRRIRGGPWGSREKFLSCHSAIAVLKCAGSSKVKDSF